METASDQLLKKLTQIRTQLARTEYSSLPRAGAPTTQEVSRMLDSIAENAVYLRARMEHGDTPKATRLIRRVRKALGYTYP
jgi:hypothetical protein